jgi:origin recognition complex subunit 5
LSRLESTFPVAQPASTSIASTHAYSPTLRPLHKHFIIALHAVLSPFSQDPDVLAYVAAARWPGFVQPILDEAERQHAEFIEEAGEDSTGTVEYDLPPVDEETRIRLLRLFTPSFTTALDVLHPRYMDAAAWVQADAVATSTEGVASMDPASRLDESIRALPRLARFVLVAAYLASTNPAKSDLRMFGRLEDGSKRRRRKGGGTRKAKAGSKTGAVKVDLIVDNISRQ